MKNFLTAAFAAAVLLAAPSAFAAPNQEGPRRPPAVQGPAHSDGRNPDQGYDRGPNQSYDRGPRPDHQAPDRRDVAPDPARYDRAPRYGYEPTPPAYPQPQPRRPVAVAIQIHL